MRVLVQNRTSKSRGITAVLDAVGHKVTTWESEFKPAFDAFDECEPEIFIGSAATNAVSKCIAERPRMRVCSIDDVEYAADTFAYYRGSVVPELTCQIAVVGDVSQKIFDEVITPLLDKNVKIVGGKRWPIPQYLGHATRTTLADLYTSATVSLALFPHKSVYDILICGGFPITMTLPKGFEYDDVCMAKDVGHMHELVRQHVGSKMTQVREKYMRSGMEVLRDRGTYWHRAAELFGGPLRLEHEADRILEIYNETVRL